MLRRYRPSPAGRRDQGSITVEMVVLTPALVLVMLFVAAAGRMVEAQSQVDGAARDGARAASVQRDGGQVRPAAIQAAGDDLNPTGGKSVCPDGLSTGAQPEQVVNGHASQVQVTVACTINLLIVPSVTVTGSAVAPVDTFMERTW